ncbi:unnamed protein product, partial [Bubo scandiacus]
DAPPIPTTVLDAIIKGQEDGHAAYGIMVTSAPVSSMTCSERILTPSFPSIVTVLIGLLLVINCEKATVTGPMLPPSVMAMPVVVQGNQRVWHPFDWKTVNQLQRTVMDFGYDNKQVMTVIQSFFRNQDVIYYRCDLR